MKGQQAELSPVCAIVGGIGGQDAIKVLSSKDMPIQNFFLFDSQRNKGLVENIAVT